MDKFSVDRASVEKAILRVSNEIRATHSRFNWKQISEDKLWFSLVSCILGSRIKYEIAKKYSELLMIQHLLHPEGIIKDPTPSESAISNCLNTPTLVNGLGVIRYPFSRIRARHIVQSCISIYSDKTNSLKLILLSASSPEHARKILVNLCYGIGPKQASLFLRNIDYSSSLAIFDTHIIRFMHLIGLIEQNVKITSLNQYARLEGQLRSYAKSLGQELAILDYAIWVVMKVISEECAFHGCSIAYVRRN